MADVLASWNEGAAKKAIVDFLATATEPGPGFVEVADRLVAVVEPFEPSTVSAAGVAVYHLGDNGTARALLKEWPLTNRLARLS